MTIKVNEIFHSIQGESLYSGMPCIFIRLSGCNLRCSYCDTRYAYEEGNFLEKADIIDKISMYKCNLIELTGGEPLYQQNTPSLINTLLNIGYDVLIETNGSLDINLADKRCTRIVDIKCPSSKESEKNDLNNLNKLTDKDQIKFVIGNRDDFNFAMDIIKSIKKDFPMGNILLSAVTGILHPQELSSWLLKSTHQVRLQLQLHKIIWPNIEKGV